MSTNTTAVAAAAANRAFDIEMWTMYASGVLVTALRTYARWKAIGFRSFRADDYLVWVAIIFYSAQSALAYSVGAFAQGLANNGMTDAERAVLSPDDPEYAMRVLGSKIQVIGWTTYTLLIGSLKLSILVFYVRLTEGLSRRYRMPIWAGFGLVGSSIIASVLAVMLSCRPFHHYWQINPDPGSEFRTDDEDSCEAAVSKPIVFTAFSSNVLTDIYLILIPAPLLWESSLRLMKKIAASIVLSAGIFVLVCAVLKTIFLFTDDTDGAQLAGAWGTREAFVAVCTTNLPLIFPLLKVWLRPLFGSVLRSSENTYKNPTGFRTIGGGDGNSNAITPRSHRVKTRPSHSTAHGSAYSTKNPLTMLSLTESEERIIGNGGDVRMQILDISVAHVSGNRPSNGIMVSNEVEITSENRNNGTYNRHGVTVQDTWRPAGL
ncbi:hypothetical protein BX600DRAFT_514584 [Xylariales sp. PMI_506]|nr:hypothetical protein BX600DRAFT_514584 [Xylariales sp. PMI_506]